MTLRKESEEFLKKKTITLEEFAAITISMIFRDDYEPRDFQPAQLRNVAERVECFNFLIDQGIKGEIMTPNAKAFIEIRKENENLKASLKDLKIEALFKTEGNTFTVLEAGTYLIKASSKDGLTVTKIANLATDMLSEL